MKAVSAIRWVRHALGVTMFDEDAVNEARHKCMCACCELSNATDQEDALARSLAHPAVRQSLCSFEATNLTFMREVGFVARVQDGESG